MAGTKAQVKRVNKDIKRLQDANDELRAEIAVNEQMIDLYNQTLVLITPEEIKTNGVVQTVPA